MATDPQSSPIKIEDHGVVDSILMVRLRLRTDQIEVVSGGLPISPDSEDFMVGIPPTFPWDVPFEQACVGRRQHVSSTLGVGPPAGLSHTGGSNSNALSRTHAATRFLP